MMELSVNEKRILIARVYPSASWKDKVSKMSDAQVTAIYIRFTKEQKL